MGRAKYRNNVIFISTKSQINYLQTNYLNLLTKKTENSRIIFYFFYFLLFINIFLCCLLKIFDVLGCVTKP